MQNPIKMDDLGVPLFSETAILYFIKPLEVEKDWGNESEIATASQSHIVAPQLMIPQKKMIRPEKTGEVAWQQRMATINLICPYCAPEKYTRNIYCKPWLVAPQEERAN